MNRFFSRNIDSCGRWLRGALGIPLVVSGVLVCSNNLWGAVALIIAGGFCLFEAVRGWCVMRACGIKTKF